MKRWLCIVVAAAVVISAFLGHSIFNSMAGEGQDRFARYYKSIQIQNGDSLWSIADEYRKNSTLTVEEYMRELCEMNQLKSDTIHAGQYLTVVYFEDMQN